jgi:8-oxo-dGTP pyrophosphatase MutT (NUDIX family)
VSAPAGRVRVERQHSAGGVVVRDGQMLLIATAGGRRWQLPKGRIEPGESAEQAAVREVREETGVTGRIVAPLAGVDYWFAEGDRRRIKKHVDFFLLEYLDGSESNFDPREVDVARWFPADEGVERLTHASERRVAAEALEKSREIVANGGSTASDEETPT